MIESPCLARDLLPDLKRDSISWRIARYVWGGCSTYLPHRSSVRSKEESKRSSDAPPERN
ncbi:arabinose ABC transporter permease [Anopheles sinensis]|uniref:Arabinose ABC transporter permease n=1 Tax=Anopheles sinensis TaxID=74873 RepID=A0A084VY43_ANOSI|nr:arabinose ABC transporter permease [Anopheles sinensis]